MRCGAGVKLFNTHDPGIRLGPYGTLVPARTGGTNDQGRVLRLGLRLSIAIIVCDLR
jgi:hypothetical protein